jgi:hypothetical protein
VVQIRSGVLVYLWPIVIVLVVYVAHLVRRQQLRKRIAEWTRSRERLSDEEFYLDLGLPSITKAAAISVRATVGDAVRIPKDLIRPNDSVAQLEKVGDPSHPSTADYFEDMWSIVSPKDNAHLITVRDFVIAFGPKVK